MCGFDDLVSIIVPIYNVEKYLDKLIVSLTEQTYTNIEIILVEDGSPDSCGNICDRYAQNDSRIIVIHQSNSGGCAARNAGLDKATGDYIMFVDGDDWLASDAVEHLLFLSHEFDSDVSVSLQNYTTRDLIQTPEPYLFGKWTPEEAIVHYLYLRTAMGCWNKLYKTDLVKSNNIRFDIPWYGEGMYFISMAFSKANSIAYSNKKIYYYRMNNVNSAVTKYNVSNAYNALWNIKNIKKKIPIRTSRVIHCINWHIWLNYYLLLKHIVATGNQNKYRRLVVEVILTLPFLMPYVVIHAEISNQDKLSLIKKSFFPMRYAKKDILCQDELLKKDLLNWANKV